MECKALRLVNSPPWIHSLTHQCCAAFSCSRYRYLHGHNRAASQNSWLPHYTAWMHKTLHLPFFSLSHHCKSLSVTSFFHSCTGKLEFFAYFCFTTLWRTVSFWVSGHRQNSLNLQFDLICCYTRVCVCFLDRSTQNIIKLKSWTWDQLYSQVLMLTPNTYRRE